MQRYVEKNQVQANMNNAMQSVSLYMYLTPLLHLSQTHLIHNSFFRRVRPRADGLRNTVWRHLNPKDAKRVAGTQ